jgi:hypothetical protein
MSSSQEPSVDDESDEGKSGAKSEFADFEEFAHLLEDSGKADQSSSQVPSCLALLVII